MKVKCESEVAQSCLTLATPWTAAYQAPPPMGFSRQEYWNGVPSLSPAMAWAQSLVGELRSHKPHGVAKKKKESPFKKKNEILSIRRKSLFPVVETM